MRTLQELKDELLTIREEKQAAILECQERISDVEKSIQKVEDDKQKAEQEVNVKKYEKATNDLWSLKVQRGMYQKRLGHLEGETLTEEQEKAFKQELEDNLAKQSKEHYTKAQELVQELEKLFQESQAMTQEGKEILGLIEYDLMNRRDNPFSSYNLSDLRERYFRDTYLALSQYEVFKMLLAGEYI